MAFIMIDEPFVCGNCGYSVGMHPSGSARNHCPKCLCSLHVDADFPGDRKAECHGIMEAVFITQSAKKGYVITHKCQKCDKQINNKCAEDDEILPFIRLQATKQ